EYVTELLKFNKKGGSRMQQLNEHLLMNALIEARSCERFKLLWKNLKDKELQKFYYELMVSEAGHYMNFIELAKYYYPEDKVLSRWSDWLEYEADVLRKIGLRGDRMH